MPLFLLFILPALVVCGVVAMGLLARFAGKKAVIIVLGTAAVLLVAFVIYAQVYRRSSPGRIVRWFAGHGLAAQDAEDEAEDLRGSPLLAELQNWSAETMTRFQAEQVTVSTNSSPPFGPFLPFPFAVRLASQEKPEFIKQRWGDTNGWGEESPQIYILHSASGKAESVAIAWYSHGLVFGEPAYQLPFEPWHQTQVVSGVYEYVIGR